MAILLDLDNAKKPWDEQHVQLFHRINSDNFDGDRDPASGNAFKAGARSIKDFKESALADVLANGAVKAVQDALTGLIPQGIATLLKQFDQAAGDALQKKLDEIDDAIAKLIASTIEGLLFSKYIRSIPAWVPVERVVTPVPEDEKDDKKLKAAVDKNNKEREDFEKSAKENEIEGVLMGSYQMPRGIPFLQWNRWFNWAFDISPIKGYRYMVGNGNVHDDSESKDLDDRDDPKQAATDVNEGAGQGLLGAGSVHSMQCLMDFGAFARTPGEVGDKQFASGPMFQNGWPFWPAGGDYFWAAGRWVYDCTHPTSDDKDKGLFPTQMHPVKAFACARYEGFKFDENERPAPAVRFLFFATKRGGYLNFGAKGKDVADDECGIKIDARDYEFILDLPEAPAPQDIEWAIGHGPIADANTLVLRPALLIDLKFAPFTVDTGTFAKDLAFDQSVIPKVRLLKPADPKRPTQRQVKVTIPLSTFDASKDAYGVCISLGWFDPTGELADGTKRIELKFDGIKFLDDHKDVRLSYSANGRYVHKALGKVPENVQIDLTRPTFLLFVPDDGIVQLAALSVTMNGFGRFMEESNDERRTLAVGGIFHTPEDLRKLLDDAKKKGAKTVLDQLFKRAFNSDFLASLSDEALELLTGQRVPVAWKKHVDQADSDVASAVAREMFAGPPAPIFNDQNEPLGMVESAGPLKNFAPTADNSPGENPVLLRDLVKKLNSSPVRFGFDFDNVHKLDAVGNADKLAFKTAGKTIVFQLRTELNVSRQPDS